MREWPQECGSYMGIPKQVSYTDFGEQLLFSLALFPSV